MGSLKALQEWCRIQCENHNDVEIKNMSSSFRDGLAFCAIIHRYRPDLIDFDSLSKENVYENNRLAFEVAEVELGIPALLDPEDMVSMKVPDRLSVITYVSQYYNYFTNKSHANPPSSMKRPSGTGHTEPAQKRPVAPLEDRVGDPERPPSQTGELEAGVVEVKRSTLSSLCVACRKHVHLVQRFLVDGKLYHRNCFRCRECSSTLLPGSYKAGSEAGSLVCTHHFTRSTLANQNGRPDISKKPTGIQSARISRPTPPPTPPSGKEPMPLTPPSEEVHIKTPPPEGVANKTPTKDSTVPSPPSVSETNSFEEQSENGRETEVTAPLSAPPNPFDDSDEEGEEAGAEGEGEDEESQTPAKVATNGDHLPPTPTSRPVGGVGGRPVPAPRRVCDSTPPPRPIRPPRVTDSPALNGEEGGRTVPTARPRDRSHSPGSSSLSTDTLKPKDPPWLALVQSETKKKPAPPPPPGGVTPPRAGSLSSLKGPGSRPATPPTPANPFDDDEDEEAGREAEEEEAAAPGAVAPAVVASHPWYSITQAGEGAVSDTPPSGGSSSRSASPGGSKIRKGPAPRPPQPPSTNAALPHSQPSSSSPSPAISIESLSSASDHSSSHPPLRGVARDGEDHPFTKSVSEPSICGPCDSASPPSSSSSAERLPHFSQGSSPSGAPANTSSAPSTPQTNRSARPPPPRPPATPSPLAGTGGPASLAPPSRSKRPKENPFNRKASPSPTPPKSRPPRGPRPARPPAPGHGFPLIKRKVQSDQYIPVEDIHGEMSGLERQLDELEQRGVELERRLRDNPNDEEEEHMLVDWFTLIHEKHLLVRREAELVYTAKQQNLEERQADVEYELRCLLNKPEKDWSEEDKAREQELMAELVTIIEQRNQIINNMDQDRQRDEEEDKLLAAMLKKKDFQKEPESDHKKKKSGKFKPMKVLKRLSHKGEAGKGQEKS